MKKTFPQRGKWIQSNRGDIFGSLWATYNIDLTTNRGKVLISPRTRVNTDVNDDADFSGASSAFVRTDADGTDRWWVLWSDVLAKSTNTDPSGNSPQFTQDGISDSPTNTNYDISDMVEFDGALIVAEKNQLYRLYGGTWDNTWGTVTIGISLQNPNGEYPHPLHVSKSSRRLLVGDGSYLHAINTNDNVVNDTAVLPEEYKIIWIRSGSDRNWIGTWNESGGKAAIFEYSELQDNYDNAYEVESDIAMAGVVKNDVCYSILRNGRLVAFSGGGFEPVANLPIADSPYEWKESSESGVYGHRLVHPNGMTLIDGNIHILIKNYINGVNGTISPNTSLFERFPAGIWEYDEEIGLYHKYSLSTYDGSIDDYGKPYVFDNVGALAETKKKTGRFLTSAVVRAGGSEGTLGAVFHLDDGDTLGKRGYITLSEMQSSEIQDTWQTIYATFKQFENSTDRIIFKYRKDDDTSLPIDVQSGTWSDSDTFTSTDSAMSNVSAGDEIFILTGQGSGTLVHVSSISESGGTYTVNLEETVNGASSGLLRFYVNDWTDLTALSSQNTKYGQKDIAGDASEKVQIKVELRGNGQSPELNRLIITHIPSLFAEN